MLKSNYIDNLIGQFEENLIKSSKKIDIDSSGIYRVDLSEKKVIINIKSNLTVILKIYIKIDVIDIKLNIESQSNLGYYLINEASVSSTNIDISENAFVESYEMNTAQETKTSFIVNLNGYNSTINHNVGLYLTNNENQKHYTKVNHLHPTTISNINETAVLNENAICHIDVQSFIKKRSSKSSAYQKSKIINLGEMTTAKINPVLLIDDYDVTGGHGATISKINDEDLYYMQSRGINKTDALKLITIGALLDNVPKYLNDEIQVIIERRIENEEL